MMIEIKVETWKELVKLCGEHRLSSYGDAINFLLIDYYGRAKPYEEIKEFINETKIVQR